MIDSFSGEYAFLSNFYRSEVVWSGFHFQTVEHAFQAAKCEMANDASFHEIRLAKTPGIAKKLGQKVTLRADWEDAKVGIMKELIVRKFASPLGDQLLATGNHFLVEGNTWGDTFWGVCNGNGRNVLGQLLMEERAMLK